MPGRADCKEMSLWGTMCWDEVKAGRPEMSPVIQPSSAGSSEQSGRVVLGKKGRLNNMEEQEDLMLPQAVQERLDCVFVFLTKPTRFIC